MTIGLRCARRFPANEILPYIVAQLIGSVTAAFLLLQIASGVNGFALEANWLAVNGLGALSPGGYSVNSGAIMENCADVRLCPHYSRNKRLPYWWE